MIPLRGRLQVENPREKIPVKNDDNNVAICHKVDPIVQNQCDVNCVTFC